LQRLIVESLLMKNHLEQNNLLIQDCSLEVGIKQIENGLAYADAESDNKTAFNRLYELHSSYVYNVCIGILGNPDDARDAMQDTFVQLFRSLQKIRERDVHRTWLYRVAVNKCMDFLRRNRKSEDIASLDWVAFSQESSQDGVIELQVRQAVLKLRPDYRVVIVLFYFEQLSYSQIAESLGCTHNQVRIRLHRARKAFRNVYEADGGDRIEV
jgi:RNA polymerase sigma-70 factor, ECF subfamily